MIAPNRFSRFTGRLLRASLALLTAAVLAGCATTGSNDLVRFDELRTAIRESDYERANALIRAHPSLLDDRRAVSMAIALGKVDAVARYASQAGANTALDLDGTPPLLRSVTAAPAASREEIVSVLLKLGADPRLQDKNGTDAATLARRRGERRLLALMNDALGMRSDRSLVNGTPAAARWMPDFETGIVRRTAATRGPADRSGRRPPAAEAKAGKAAGAAAVKVSLPARAPATPEFLFADSWIAAPPDVIRTGEVAGFRFHADGTGELLRFGPARGAPRRADNAFVAWVFDDGRLRFFVSSPQFSARCESRSLQASRVNLQCTDFHPVDDYEVSPGQPAVARVPMSIDMARALIDGQPPGAGLQAGATLTATLHTGPPGACALRTRSFKAPPETQLKHAPGDWYTLNSRSGITRSALSGEACHQDEARRASLASCTREGGSCRSLGGCRAGQASAAASVHGAGWGWGACAADAEAAKLAALARCRAESGCDCQLVALAGNNVNTARGAICHVPGQRRLQLSRAPMLPMMPAPPSTPATPSVPLAR
ncbi:MAG TPA: hypothetical protein PKA20_16600 [Burkholderiaceae bacterium]|nr:hypothetical protein [Burkholderiaceae bacterium]